MRMRDALGEAQTGNRRLRGRAFGFSWIHTFGFLTEFAQAQCPGCEDRFWGYGPLEASAPAAIAEISKQTTNKHSSLAIVLDRAVQMW